MLVTYITEKRTIKKNILIAGPWQAIDRSGFGEELESLRNDSPFILGLPMRKQTDLGLLILRGAGLLLALTFGVKRSVGIGRLFTPENPFHQSDWRR